MADCVDPKLFDIVGSGAIAAEFLKPR